MPTSNHTVPFTGFPVGLLALEVNVAKSTSALVTYALLLDPSKLYAAIKPNSLISCPLIGVPLAVW